MYIAVVVVFCVAFVNLADMISQRFHNYPEHLRYLRENPIYMVVLAVIAAVLFLGGL